MRLLNAASNALKKIDNTIGTALMKTPDKIIYKPGYLEDRFTEVGNKLDKLACFLEGDNEVFREVLKNIEKFSTLGLTVDMKIKDAEPESIQKLETIISENINILQDILNISSDFMQKKEGTSTFVYNAYPDTEQKDPTVFNQFSLTLGHNRMQTKKELVDEISQEEILLISQNFIRDVQSAIINFEELENQIKNTKDFTSLS